MFWVELTVGSFFDLSLDKLKDHMKAIISLICFI